MGSTATVKTLLMRQYINPEATRRMMARQAAITFKLIRGHDLFFEFGSSRRSRSSSSSLTDWYLWSFSFLRHLSAILPKPVDNSPVKRFGGTGVLVKISEIVSASLLRAKGF